MKIKIEIDESAAEDEVIIRCRGLTKQVRAARRAGCHQRFREDPAL
jgi:hypothetical protein